MKFLIARSAWHPISLLAVLSLWIGTVGNLPFWLAIWRLPETQGLRALSTMGSLWLILVCLLLWFLCLWVWPRWLKPAAVVMLITVTSSSYFMVTYGVVIDPSMLANVVQTDVREVRDLLSWNMLATFAGGVILPGLWLWVQPVRKVKTLPLIGRQLAVSVLALLVGVGMFWAAFQDIASLTRTHKHLRYMINPFNSVLCDCPFVCGQSELGLSATANAGRRRAMDRQCHSRKQRTIDGAGVGRNRASSQLWFGRVCPRDHATAEKTASAGRSDLFFQRHVMWHQHPSLGAVHVFTFGQNGL